MSDDITAWIKPEGRSVVTYESTSVEIFMDREDRSARLSNLFSVNRGKGYATELMKYICRWADDNGIHLWLKAKPYGTPIKALSQKELEAFYRKFGFVKELNSNEMHRNV